MNIPKLTNFTYKYCKRLWNFVLLGYKTKTFVDFRSLCAIFLLWKYHLAFVNWSMMSIATVDSNGYLCWDPLNWWLAIWFAHFLGVPCLHHWLQTPLNLSTKKGLLETPLYSLLHLPKLLLYQSKSIFYKCTFALNLLCYTTKYNSLKIYFFNQRIFLVGIGVLTWDLSRSIKVNLVFKTYKPN